MSISLSSAAQRIRDRITEKSESAVGYSIASLKGLIPTLCEEFARMVAVDPMLQEHLRPTVPFSNTITAGVADLAPNIAAPDLLLLDAIMLGEIRLSPDTLGLPFHWVNEQAQLAFQRLGESMFITCAVQGRNLLVRNVDGDLAASLGAISISAPFVPVIAASAASSTLPFELEGAFVNYAAQRVLHVPPPYQPRPRPQQVVA